MIKIKNISKSYVKDRKVLDAISLEINAGEVFGIFGQNGAGKTTLIRIITGIMLPDEGDVIINDSDLFREPIRTKQQFSLMPDSPEIYSKIRGIDWLHFIGSVYNLPINVTKDKIEVYGEKFEMKEALYKQIGTYSFGMKHKLSLIAGLMNEPPALIFDEPLQGLDPTAAYWLKEVMREHASKGGVVIFSTHLLDIAEKICTRFAILKNGHFITIENMKDIIDKKINLESYFMELTND